MTPARTRYARESPTSARYASPPWISAAVSVAPMPWCSASRLAVSRTARSASFTLWTIARSGAARVTLSRRLATSAVSPVALATSPASAPPIPSDTASKTPRSPTGIDASIGSESVPGAPSERSAATKASSLFLRTLPTSVRAAIWSVRPVAMASSGQT